MVKDPYARSAKIYDFVVEPFAKKLRSIGDDLFFPDPGMAVLDIGCGTGTHLEIYRTAGCEVFGIDLSPAMVEICRRKLDRRGEIYLGDASNLPFADEAFDFVLSSITIHEMPSGIRSAVMKEAKRVMKSSGRYLIIDYHVGQPEFPQIIFYRMVTVFFEILAGREHYKNYREFMSNGGLQPYINGCGYLIDDKKTIDAGEMVFYLLRK
jgi:demethylmenaquinone methyltransferase/2-methoxy-6-polyprenyl-1,4-benzoquinol methylase